MSHICILFINFIYEHLSDMIDLGWLYIGSSPLYRVNVKGKWKYYKNDNDYIDFVTEVIEEKYKTTSKKLTVNKIMLKSEEFRDEFNRLKSKYNIHKDVLSVFYHHDDIKEIKKELKSKFKLKIYKSKTVEGLYDSIWHEFNYEELFYEIDYLKEIYDNKPFITLYNKNDRTKNKYEVYDAIVELNKSFKYVRNRLKGLGELDGDELWLTSLNPDTRVLIKVTKEYTEEESQLFTILFGNNPKLRKEFIKEYLK